MDNKQDKQAIKLPNNLPLFFNGSDPAHSRSAFSSTFPLGVLREESFIRDDSSECSDNQEKRLSGGLLTDKASLPATTMTRETRSLQTRHSLRPADAMTLLQQMASHSRRRSIFSRVASPNSARSPYFPIEFTHSASSDRNLVHVSSEDGLYGYENPPKCRDSGDIGTEWNRLISNRPEMFNGSAEIERLLNIGIPRSLRSQAWAWLGKRELIQKHQIEAIPNISIERFKELILPAKESPCSKEIEADIGRTLTDVPYFSAEENGSKGKRSLFNVLKAYSLVDPEVGYCQGMNFIAGILLMHANTEYEAFTLLLLLMYGFKMRKNYLPTMEGLKLSMYKLTRLLDSDMPDILEHLILHNVPPDLLTASWFLTLFSAQFPVRFSVRIFDLVFYGGYDMVFNAIYKLYQVSVPALLAHEGFEEVTTFFNVKLPMIFPDQFEAKPEETISLSAKIWNKLYSYEIEFGIFQEEQNEIESFNVETSVRENEPTADGSPNSLRRKSEDRAIFMSEGSVSSRMSSAILTVQELSDELCMARLKCADLAHEVEELRAALVSKDDEIRRLQNENAVVRGFGNKR